MKITLFILMLATVTASAEPWWVDRKAEAVATRPAWLRPMTPEQKAAFDAETARLLIQARIEREQAERDAQQAQIAATLQLLLLRQAQQPQFPRR